MDQTLLNKITAYTSVGVMAGTFILAVVTTWLAWVTKNMAKSTSDLINQEKVFAEQESKRHIDNLRPICVLEPSILTEIKNDFSDILCKSYLPIQVAGEASGSFVSTTKDEYLTKNGSIVFLRCSICNKGVGPALYLKIILRILDKYRDFEQKIPSGAIQPGETWEKKGVTRGMTEQTSVIPLKIKFDNSYHDGDYSSIEGSHWEIFLEYQDIFGNPFYTKYTKSGDDFFAGSFSGHRPEMPEKTPANLGNFEITGCGDF